MKYTLSARNQFPGKVISVEEGAGGIRGNRRYKGYIRNDWSIG